MSAVPLKLSRLASNFLATSFGVIGMGVGINALVKSNQQKSNLRHAAPSGTTVNIDTSDVLDSGIVLTVVCGLLALNAFLSSLLLLASPRSLSSRTLPLQTGLFAFLTMWLFASLVPFTDFFANRSAKVTAFLGNVPIPQTIIQQVENSLGATSVYHEIDYLRLGAILPWFAFLFGLTSTILSFMAQRQTASAPAPAAAASAADEESSPVDEKRDSEHVA